MKVISTKCERVSNGINAETKLDLEIPGKRVYLYVNFHCGKSETYSVTQKSILAITDDDYESIEKYDDLEEAKESRFYPYFEELTTLVEEQ